MTTFDLIDCLAYDGPHCDCFLAEGAECCYCGEIPPPEDEEEDDEED